MDFINVYEDSLRTESYAKLDFPGTYFLAYRDIPSLIKKYIPGNPPEAGAEKALDFGCGAGRSTRFLKNLGFDAVGSDISSNMIKKARESDPGSNYILTSENPADFFKQGSFKLITAVFTFDNIPGVDYRVSLMKQLGRLLSNKGIIILVNSTPEIYLNEWLSFSTKDFPENRSAKSGDKVKIIMTDVEDKRPVEDIVWFDNDYPDLFLWSGMKLIETHKPLGMHDEPYSWVNEIKIAPRIIYILQK